MFKKILLFLAVPIKLAMLVTVFGVLDSAAQSSEALNRFQEQMRVFKAALNDTSGNDISKEDHERYYRSVKWSWMAGSYKSKAYPYDEPYYSQHKDIAAKEQACVSELIDLQASVMNNMFHSAANGKVSYATDPKAVINMVNKIKSMEGDTPNLLTCQLHMISLDLLSDKTALKLASMGRAVDLASLLIFSSTGNKSDLKTRLLTSSDLQEMAIIVAAKELKKKRMYKLLNPRSFGN